ncbi:MAG TPA: glycosyltransferase family 39 protein [Acidisarcina sp.]
MIKSVVIPGAPSVMPTTEQTAGRDQSLVLGHAAALAIVPFPRNAERVPIRLPQLHFKTILIVALLPRLAVVYYVLSHYPRGWLFTKGMELGILGRLLALGQPFNSPFGGSTGPTAFIAPGYPFVISVIFRFFGILTQQSTVAILLLHVAFSVATVAMIVHIARVSLGVRVANLAGFGWALSPALVWMPIIFWDTSASTMLLTAMVAMALRLARRPSLLLWCGAGLASGLTMLINPSLFVALFAILGWAVTGGWHIFVRRGRCAALLSPRCPRYAPLAALAIMLAVFLPWPVRNLRVMHAFIPFRSNLGYELWNGNQHGGTGRFVETLHPMLSKVQYGEYAAMGEVAYMRDRAERGKASIRRYPLEFLRRTAWRIPAFWLGWAQGGVSNSGLVTLHAAGVSCLGMVGLLLLFKRKRQLAWLFLLPLLLFPLPYYVTHPDFRFRLLVDPILTVLAAYALVAAWRFLGRRRSSAVHAPHVWR